MTAPGADGPTRFARFAFPPNELGYCGPADHAALFSYGATGVVDEGLRALARRFEGAWPYLELIAGAHGIDDPLDDRVIDAYWLGGPLLDRLGSVEAQRSLPDFAAGAGPAWALVHQCIADGARPSHGFHVFTIYPWLGLLRAGTSDPALRVLDRCRIRWGRVLDVGGTDATVESAPLTWDGSTVGLGAPRPEVVRIGRDGTSLVSLRTGDDVAMHWDWVCERLDAPRLASLQADTAHQLAMVNQGQRGESATG